MKSKRTLVNDRRKKGLLSEIKNEFLSDGATAKTGGKTISVGIAKGDDFLIVIRDGTWYFLSAADAFPFYYRYYLSIS